MATIHRTQQDVVDPITAGAFKALIMRVLPGITRNWRLPASFVRNATGRIVREAPSVANTAGRAGASQAGRAAQTAGQGAAHPVTNAARSATRNVTRFEGMKPAQIKRELAAGIDNGTLTRAEIEAGLAKINVPLGQGKAGQLFMGLTYGPLGVLPMIPWFNSMMGQGSEDYAEASNKAFQGLAEKQIASKTMGWQQLGLDANTAHNVAVSQQYNLNNPYLTQMYQGYGPVWDQILAAGNINPALITPIPLSQEQTSQTVPAQNTGQSNYY